jgi:predicted methyltransferase
MKALLAAAALALTSPALAAPPFATALADPARPAEDVARDAARKPGEMLRFARISPGAKVGDFVMGGGYFTRILAKAVGPAGKVYAFQPSEFVGFMPKYGEQQDTVAAAYPNVIALRTTFATLTFAEPLDAILTAQNYHDLHLKGFPADTATKVDAILFAALKPGGTLLVIDHAAQAGSGLRDANTLHRIDPATVRSELEAAGFRYDGMLAILASPADPHTKNVFDPAIRGKTDQFVLRFRKPA